MSKQDIEKSREMMKLAVRALENKKGEDIRVLDISEVSTLGDYFVIASGASAPQLDALRDETVETLSRAGYEPRSVEGSDHAKWVLIDFGDVIVHIFDRENRIFYDLERIWRDGKPVDPEKCK